jgi:hypothetical protein
MAIPAYPWACFQQVTLLDMRRACSLPWPLCAVRGDEDPAASEQVEAAVGNVVEDGVSHGGLESGENSGQGQRAR